MKASDSNGPRLAIAEPGSYRPVRRVVTGEDEQGRSIIVSDGPAPNATRAEGMLAVSQVLWATGDAAAPGDDPAPRGHFFGFHSEGGSLLRIGDLPPDETVDAEALQKFLTASDVGGDQESRHFWFHKTASLDYAIVLEGEVYAMMDVGETLLRAGDVLIQRGTNHSWSNRSGKWCRMAFVLLALPPEQDQ